MAINGPQQFWKPTINVATFSWGKKIFLDLVQVLTREVSAWPITLQKSWRSLSECNGDPPFTFSSLAFWQGHWRIHHSCILTKFSACFSPMEWWDVVFITCIVLGPFSEAGVRPTWSAPRDWGIPMYLIPIKAICQKPHSPFFLRHTPSSQTQLYALQLLWSTLKAMR